MTEYVAQDASLPEVSEKLMLVASQLSEDNPTLALQGLAVALGRLVALQANPRPGGVEGLLTACMGMAASVALASRSQVVPEAPPQELVLEVTLSNAARAKQVGETAQMLLNCAKENVGDDLPGLQNTLAAACTVAGTLTALLSLQQGRNSSNAAALEAIDMLLAAALSSSTDLGITAASPFRSAVKVVAAPPPASLN